MATFVLVHGAWSGAFLWRSVTPLLRGAGHEVVTPTLTGLGERAHLATPEVGLETHVRDVVAVLEVQDLREVQLVGFSYAGMVITGAADRVANRVGQLVYVDGPAPKDGESWLDLAGSARRALLERRAGGHGDGWLVPPPPPGEWTSWLERGDISTADVGWFRDRQRPQPLKTLRDPLRLTGSAAEGPPRTYIYCTVGKEQGGSLSSRRARAEGWGYRELSTGHMAPLLAPRELTDLLLEIAAEPGRRGGFGASMRA